MSAAARQIIQSLRQAAQDLPFKEVDELVELRGGACAIDRHDRNNPLRWLLIQAQADVKVAPLPGGWGDEYAPVAPECIFAFSTWPGDGCEEANFGLCRYPATVRHKGKDIETHLSGWRWHSFCKTQYSSSQECGGLANFLRCHLGIVALLDKAEELGCLDTVHDEGRFWDSRDIKALVPEIASWNQTIAAFAGRLKDALGDGLEAPITEYPDFEQLELAGQSQLPPQLQQLTQLIQQVVKRT